MVFVRVKENYFFNIIFQIVYIFAMILIHELINYPSALKTAFH